MEVVGLDGEKKLLAQWKIVMFSQRAFSRRNQFSNVPTGSLYTLQILENGRFVLFPEKSTQNLTVDEFDRQLLVKCAKGRRMDPGTIRGSWKLRRNPYCLTDRYFDELTLVSKTQVRLNSKFKEMSKIEFHCKLRGGCGCPISKRFLRSRLTQGTVLLIREGHGIPLWKRRAVISAFQSARQPYHIVGSRKADTNLYGCLLILPFFKVL